MASVRTLVIVAVGSLVGVVVNHAMQRRMKARREATEPLPENTSAELPPRLDRPIATVKGGTIGVAILLVRRLFHKRAARRRHRAETRDTPALTPTTADGARAQVTGTIALLDAPLVAPLSGTPCVAYHTRLHADGTHFPSIQHETLRSCRFVLDDAVVIDSQHLRLDFPAVKLPTSVEQNARYDAFARTFGLARRDTRFETPEKYAEVRLAAGLRVTVVGTVVRDPVAPTSEELGFRDQPPARVRLVGNADHPVVIGPARNAAKS